MHDPNSPSHTHNTMHLSNPDIRTLCQHTFQPTTSQPARPCNSPALRGESFCYYHHPTRTPTRTRHDLEAARARRLARKRLKLPLPTTRAELRHSLLYLMQLIATDEIDTRRAGLLILALQTAGKHLDR